jgi:hypothetical protein
MEVLLLLVMGITNIFCFFIGAKVGQQVTKGERVEMPSLNPFEAVRQHEAKKEAQHRQDIIDTIVGNMEAYDGTGNGQKDVPRR